MDNQNSVKRNIKILQFIREASLQDVLDESKLAREKYHQNNAYLCSIVNAKSGKCSENCAYCAQSAYHKTDIAIYPLLDCDELVNRAIEFSKAGATQFSIVTSGHSPTATELEVICEAGKKIKQLSDINLCCSLGILTKEKAESLIDAGFERYHHNLETAKSHFPNICTTHSYQDSIDTIRFAHEAGFKVCCGGIFGMGETWEQRLEFAETIASLEVDSVPINFLNPIPGTKLENLSILEAEEALRTIALFRLIFPQKNIGLCGGRELILKNSQQQLFEAGANGIMLGNYLTTSGGGISDDIRLLKNAEMQTKSI